MRAISEKIKTAQKEYEEEVVRLESVMEREIFDAKEGFKVRKTHALESRVNNILSKII